MARFLRDAARAFAMTAAICSLLLVALLAAVEILLGRDPDGGGMIAAIALCMLAFPVVFIGYLVLYRKSPVSEPKADGSDEVLEGLLRAEAPRFRKLEIATSLSIVFFPVCAVIGAILLWKAHRTRCPKCGKRGLRFRFGPGTASCDCPACGSHGRTSLGKHPLANPLKLSLLLFAVLCALWYGQHPSDPVASWVGWVFAPASRDIPGTYHADNRIVKSTLVMREDHTFTMTAECEGIELAASGSWTDLRNHGWVSIRTSDFIRADVNGISIAGGINFLPVTKYPIPFSKVRIGWNEDLDLSFIRE